MKRQRGDLFVQDMNMLFCQRLWPGALLFASICLVLGLCSGAPAALFLNPMSILGLAVILAAFWALVSAAVQKKLNERDNWRYVRSFEDIASYRPLERVV